MQNEAPCAYYIRTGQCKFGSTCKFHHPQPTNMMVSLSGSPVYPTVQSPTTPGQQSYPGGVTNWSRASFIPSPRWQGPSSYAPLILPPGVVSVPGWNAYSVSISAPFSTKCYDSCFVYSFTFTTKLCNPIGVGRKKIEGGTGGGKKIFPRVLVIKWKMERNDLYGGPIQLNILSPFGRKGNCGWNSSLYVASGLVLHLNPKVSWLWWGDSNCGGGFVVCCKEVLLVVFGGSDGGSCEMLLIRWRLLERRIQLSPESV